MVDEISDVGLIRLCMRCNFWFKTDTPEIGFGECRRHPPTLVAVAGGLAHTWWPKTKLDGWCGDFEEG